MEAQRDKRRSEAELLQIVQDRQTAGAALQRAGFRVEPFRPEGLEEARLLWRKFFVGVGGMLIRSMFKGRENDLSPTLKQFLEWYPGVAEDQVSAVLKFIASHSHYPEDAPVLTGV